MKTTIYVIYCIAVLPLVIVGAAATIIVHGLLMGFIATKAALDAIDPNKPQKP